MTVSYEHAMNTLQTMFSAADRDVIKMVLESNAGHMERTVECLLAMNLPQGPADPQQAQPARPSGPPSSQGSSGGKKGISMNNRALPDDFLRPPSYFRKAAKKNNNQVDEDALVARMLQDEMFMRELVQHQDTVRRNQRARARQQVGPGAFQAPHADPPLHPGLEAGTSPPPPLSTSPRSSSSHIAPPIKNAEPSVSFKERWSTFSEAAKKKMAVIAGKFRREDPKERKMSYMALPSLDDESGALRDEAGDGRFALVDEDDEPPASGNDIPLQDRRFKKKPTEHTESPVEEL